MLVGSYVDAGGLTQAVMFDGASFTTLDDPTVRAELDSTYELAIGDRDSA